MSFNAIAEMGLQCWHGRARTDAEAFSRKLPLYAETRAPTLRERWLFF